MCIRSPCRSRGSLFLRTTRRVAAIATAPPQGSPGPTTGRVTHPPEGGQSQEITVSDKNAPALRPETLAVHAGQTVDPTTKARAVPILSLIHISEPTRPY